MNEMEIRRKVQELRELGRMKEELEAEIAAVQDALKATMTEQNTDELTGTDYKVTWHTVKSQRLDSKALKAELPDIVKRFMIATETRRFCIA